MNLREYFIIFTAVLVVNTAGSALHGECARDDHCGTFDTYCKKSTCVCKENFAVVRDTCVALARPSVSCVKSGECHSTLGNKSICKNAQCACKTFHHLYAGQCMKSRGLDEVCESDGQCYCGEDCQDNIECSNNLCLCKPGFTQIHRRCISNHPNNSALINVASGLWINAILLFTKIIM